MSKLDELMKASRGIASESMGRPPAAAVMSRASAPLAGPMPDRLQGIARTKNAAEIPLDKIDRDPDQPREEFEPEALARLAESIRARGQLQPIRVRWDEERSLYVIVCGERRWRAARMAGSTTMSCVIMEGPISPAELLSLQLVENLVREDLKPIEQAKAFRAVMDLNGWSTHDVARELAVDQSSVVRALKLLDLPAVVQERVEHGTLSPATAYEVSKLDDPEEQVALADRVVAEGLSRAEAVEVVRRASGRSARGKGRGTRRPTTRIFRRVAGCTVTVENGRGLDPEMIRAALAEATARLDAESESEGQAA
jgi:ParB family chromosome partitioning protein